MRQHPGFIAGILTVGAGAAFVVPLDGWARTALVGVVSLLALAEWSRVS